MGRLQDAKQFSSCKSHAVVNYKITNFAHGELLCPETSHPLCIGGDTDGVDEWIAEYAN